MYDSEDGWSTEEPISVTHTENSGLIITNGKRTVVDRLNVDGFAVASIEVYGNDRNQTRPLPMHMPGTSLLKSYSDASTNHRSSLCQQQLG